MADVELRADRAVTGAREAQRKRLLAGMQVAGTRGTATATTGRSTRNGRGDWIVTLH